MNDRAYAYITTMVNNNYGKVLAVGGMPDHIHLFVSLSQEVVVADFVRKIKTNTSKMIHEIDVSYAGFAWQIGYGVFTVSASSVEIVKNYICNQSEPHKKSSFEEEYFRLLAKHKIVYDERYVLG